VLVRAARAMFVREVIASGMLGDMLTELLPPHTGLAFNAMRKLRSGLASRDDFVEQVDKIQRPTGYRLVAVLAHEDGDALAVVGFRQGTSLAWGRHLYIDDLSTVSSARAQGLATQLLAWVHEEAERLGCEQVHLDSGVGLSRATAHRLYLNSGYVISSHHFAKSTCPTPDVDPSSVHQTVRHTRYRKSGHQGGEEADRIDAQPE
jgi:GNAT superfamily N-acetyltransferase